MNQVNRTYVRFMMITMIMMMLVEMNISIDVIHVKRTRQMLPDKSIASLVKYYYSWKKTRFRTSVMDRQARKLQAGAMEEPDPNIDENANAGTWASMAIDRQRFKAQA